MFYLSSCEVSPILTVSEVMVNRIIRDDPSKGDMHNRQAINFSLLWEALKDYDMWPVYLLGLTWSVPQTPSQSYITLIIGSLGFNTFQTNLLTIPAYALFVIQLITWTRLSEYVNNRFLFVLLCQIWMLPLLIALEVLPGGSMYNWVRYVLNLLLVGYPYIHAILGMELGLRDVSTYRYLQSTVALVSRNAGSVRTRTVGTALYNMCVQLSNIISSNVSRLQSTSCYSSFSPSSPRIIFLHLSKYRSNQSRANVSSQKKIYRTPDQPYYYTGNKVLLGLTAWNIVVIIGAKAYYMWRNSVREKKWGAMSKAEREAYLASFVGEEGGVGHAEGEKRVGGNKRLDFRFVH